MNVLALLAREPVKLGQAIAVLAGATVAGAWAFQLVGLTPCELCLRERIPFYIGIGLGLATAYAAQLRQPAAARIGFGLLGLVFAASALLGAYHAGVEWKFWPGPSECSGSVAAAAKVTDFLEQLKHVTVVRCDAAALRIFGLSLAGWNVLISLLLVALASLGLRRQAASKRTHDASHGEPLRHESL